MFYDFSVRRLGTAFWSRFYYGTFWTNCYHKALRKSAIANGRPRKRLVWDDEDEDYKWQHYECNYIQHSRLNTDMTRVFHDVETGEYLFVEKLEPRKLAHHNPHAKFMG